MRPPEKKTKPKVCDITKTAGFREAMDDIEQGRVYHADSVDDMFQQILGYVPKFLQTGTHPDLF